MGDWKNNKYGLESEYSALHDAEDWKFGIVGWCVILVLVGAIAALVVGIAGWIF